MPKQTAHRAAFDMEVTLIYPHQLFAEHPAIAKGRCVYLIEDPLFFGNDPHWPCAMHKQKLVLHRASMKAYAARLQAQGIKVEYVEAPAGDQTSSDALLQQLLPQGSSKIHIIDPVDEILSRRIKQFITQRKIALHTYESPNFLTPQAFLEATLAGKKKPFMARFYEAQRKRMGILLDENGGPDGGQWSFDADNRAKLPKRHIVPREPRTIDTTWKAAAAYVEEKFPHHLGTIDDFRWPVTHEQAAEWLQQFIAERFHDFGKYEDAIAVDHAFLYHSAITPALNIGLLHPQQVLDAVLQQADQVPLNSREGFIRQIIGWREFLRGIYQFHGSSIRLKNFWGFTRPMPKSCYDGTTGIAPVDRVIRQLLREGYCHHIERLMVLGNFFLICRIRPDDVYRWFMEMFIDSYDWVMVPNVYGMSQFADGGTFTTKPYLSGSNYLKKMSNEESGPWCPVWDGLFWTFIDDHTDFFLRNPRLSMMVRTWQKFPETTKESHRKAAQDFLTKLDS